MNVMADVRWHVDLVTPPVGLPLALDLVRDEHLKVVNGTIEDSYIERLIYAAMREGERESWRSFLPQTRRLVLDRLPSDGVVVLTHPPILAIESVGYRDLDGALVEVDDYDAVIPTGPEAGYARVRPVGVVTDRPIEVTYTAGYPNAGTPPVSTIPADLQQALLLVVGEFYRTRTLSIQGTVAFPAVQQARAIFASYRPY